MDLKPDTLFVVGAVIFVLIMAIRASKRGALESVWALLGWGGGGFAAWWMFHNGAGLLRDYAEINLSDGAAVFAGVVLGVFSFVLVHTVIRTAMNRVFNPSTMLGGCLYGASGSAISVIPSLALVLAAALSLRVSGTLVELREVEVVSANPGLWQNYPNESGLVTWRNAIEGLPQLSKVLDVVDPVSKRARRNLAAILLIGFYPEARGQIRGVEGFKRVLRHSEFENLARDPRLNELIATQGYRKYFELLRDSRLKDALRNEEFRALLEPLDVAQDLRAVLYREEPRWKIFK